MYKVNRGLCGCFSEDGDILGSFHSKTIIIPPLETVESL